MGKQNVIEKCIGTEIQWQGADPTKAKKTKKKKGKKVTVVEKVDSFFNFFQTIEPSEKDLAGTKGDADEDDDNQEVGEKMDVDFDIGQVFKDDLVPLALEYFLGVID